MHPSAGTRFHRPHTCPKAIFARQQAAQQCKQHNSSLGFIEPGLVGLKRIEFVLGPRKRVMSNGDQHSEDDEGQVLFPIASENPSGLPSEVENGWNAALAVKTQTPLRYLLGRVLDAVCEEKKAKPGRLYERIENLTDSGDFPPNLRNLAHDLRKLRNYGAHADLGTLSAQDVPLLESLCKDSCITFIQCLLWSKRPRRPRARSKAPTPSIGTEQLKRCRLPIRASRS